ELSFARRTIEWLALTFGALMLIPVLLAGLVSNVLVVAIMIVTSLIFSKMMLMGRAQNEEARRELPVILGRTRVMDDYEIRYYAKRTFPKTSKSEWKMMIGYHVLLIVAGLLAILFV
ncbi:MAG: hypothetical protein ACP6KW_06225, partial [Candidatus Thorarchaeota archaeon]